jgi:two-component system phosphate regulon sensor histidine kinase PhoR
MENMNEGAVLLDQQGIILSLNKSAARIFAASQPMEGRNMLELLRDVDLLKNMRAALAGWRGEMALSRSGRDYQVYFSPVPGSGAILFFLDVSEKMRAEKLRREFSANVSHELKTPLTSISGYAEMLDSGMARAEDRKAFVKKIKHESERLLSLINDIMLLSRLDEGNPQGEFAPEEMSALARQCAQGLADKAGQMGITMEVKGEKVWGRVNRALLAELLFNLLDNAIKYNRPGGRVSVALSRESGRALLTVQDNGLGIPLPDQSRVFERFYRVEQSRSSKTGGTGLGLAIVKHIAIIHQAPITLESQEGQGTTISLSFEAA